MHSNTRVFYICIEILLTDINYMYYLYIVFVCDYVYTTIYNLFCIFNSPFVTVIHKNYYVYIYINHLSMYWYNSDYLIMYHNICILIYFVIL